MRGKRKEERERRERREKREERKRKEKEGKRGERYMFLPFPRVKSLYIHPFPLSPSPITYLEWRVADDTHTHKRHRHRHHIDSELELKELGDRVIHITSPHHRFYNGAEVVVCENDVTRFLGYVCPCDTLGKRKRRRTRKRRRLKGEGKNIYNVFPRFSLLPSSSSSSPSLPPPPFLPPLCVKKQLIVKQRARRG